MEKVRPIGILDSGVGGLTVGREIVRYLPDEKIVYYGDTLHLPYGKRLLKEVRYFVCQIIDFLLEEKQAKAIVLACNTATSAALTVVKDKYQVPIFGTIKSVIESAYQASNKKKIGVIGTEATINSQAYQKSLLNLDKKIKVFSAACPLFVELVEQGNFRGTEVKRIAHKYLDGLREAGIDVLILGCTHFPYLIPVIQEVMGEGVTLITSGKAMARNMSEVMKKNNILNGNNYENIAGQEFIVSDKRQISGKFLEKGREYLNLPSLKFKEYNIFK